MQKLRIHSFSCIDEAEFELGRLTILIGPQASGKSVISKLLYYFNSLLTDQFASQEAGQNLKQFKETAKNKFKQLFPPTAWGKKKFHLHFEAGDLQVHLTRHTHQRSLTENLRISFSPFFEQQYERTLASYSVIAKRSKPGDITAQVDAGLQIRRKAQLELRRKLGESYVESQLFIPAGRSFFTNMGKAFILLEQGNLVDPIVSKFGSFFSSLRERINFFEETSTQLLGGKVRIERDKEYIITDDGRKIPFSAMSSGQQELIPLLLALRYGGVLRKYPIERRLVYIEEPEAHLFPSAQSSLVQLLARMLNDSHGTLDLLLTTHSPYVLAKINNLLKAHTIGRTRRGSKAAAQIVPPQNWIAANTLKAFAIEEKRLKPILDQDGLIDAAYLDDVSSDISREFSALLGLELELEHEKTQLHRNEIPPQNRSLRRKTKSHIPQSS